MMNTDRRCVGRVNRPSGDEEMENKMLVLVATRETQGSDDGDYCFTVEGELVTPITFECCVPETCGCGRGFPGLASARATTTAMVVDRAGITLPLLRQSVTDSLERGGWRGIANDEFEQMVDEHVDTIVRICKAFGDGAIVRRDGPAFWADIRRTAA